MKLFLRDAALIIAVLVGLALVFAALGRTLPLGSYLAGGSVGLVAAAARAFRRRLEGDERERDYRARGNTHTQGKSTQGKSTQGKPKR